MRIQPVGEVESATQATPRHQLRNAEGEVAHIVCCRDPDWSTAFCGEPAEAINLTADVVCSMCVEAALERLPTFVEDDPRVCPIDLEPCPEEHDIDLRILREVT